MGRRLGRGRPPAALSFLWVAGSLSSAISSTALADEIILDPELTGEPTSSETSDGETVIMDPELAGASGDSGTSSDEEVIYQDDLGPSDSSFGEYEDDYDPMANTGIAHINVAAQGGVDLYREYDLEDYYDARFRFSAEVDFRISRHLRLALGTRVNFFWAAPHQNDYVLENEGRSFWGEDRYALDIIPSSAYIDVTVADGLHLRLGAQTVSMGRMDFYAPSDILGAYDFRAQAPGPGASSRLSQPAVRLDWDLSRFATLRMVYVPWFMPHANNPGRDRFVATALSGKGSVELPSSLGAELPPSWQTRNAENSMRFLGPEPDFGSPQAQARLTLRATAFEIALTGGTALEKLPSVYFAPVVDQLLRNPPNLNAELTEAEQVQLLTELATAAAAFQEAYNLQEIPSFDSVSVAYDRYYQLGFDGSFDIAPLTIGFEFSWSPERHWLVAASRIDDEAGFTKEYYEQRGGAPLPQPNLKQPLGLGLLDADGNSIDGRPTVSDKSNRAGVPMIEWALHVEWLRGQDLALIGEAFMMQALELPYDISRDWAGFIPGTGIFAGGVLAGSYSGGDNRWSATMATILAVGPSLVLAPSLEVRVSDNMYVNVGATIVEGPDPELNVVAGSAATNFTFGGIFTGYDQILFGLRWGI